MMDKNEGHGLVAPPAYDRAGVGHSASVAMGSAYSSLPDLPLLYAHNSIGEYNAQSLLEKKTHDTDCHPTQIKRTGSTHYPSDFEEIKSKSLTYGASGTEIERP
jgi:hypothetical protein